MTGALLILGLVGVLGLLFGSFANVCIARVPSEQSVVSPRSRCGACGHPIRWFDNVPLLSFALLRGRCRDCGTRFSWRYPAVELGLAIWFIVCALPFARALDLPADPLMKLAVQQIALATAGLFLVILMVIDWQHQLLPDVLTIPGTLLGLLFTCGQAVFLGDNDYNLVLRRRVNINAANSGHSTGNIFMTGAEHLIYGRLLAVVAAFLLLYSIRVLYRVVRKRDGMGLGDAKLLAMIAAFLGLYPALLALFSGVLLATGYATVLLLRRQADAATRLPFGSFLAAGGLFAALFGPRVIDAYAALFR